MTFIRWCNGKVSRCSWLKCCSTFFQEIKANLIYWTVIALHSITMFRLWMRTEATTNRQPSTFFFRLTEGHQDWFLRLFSWGTYWVTKMHRWGFFDASSFNLAYMHKTCKSRSLYICISITVKELRAPRSTKRFHFVDFTKGQLISKCPFGVFKSSKKPIPGFLP